MKVIFFLLPSLLLSCASIRKINKFDQKNGQHYTKYKGQKVVYMKKIEDLPNAFGKRDIYGGKVNKGSLVVFYVGTLKNKAKFLIVDQDIETNASVFTRYFNDKSTLQLNSYGNQTTGTVTHHKAKREVASDLPPDSYEVVIDLKKDKVLEHDYFNLHIIDATENKIKYKFLNKNTQ